MTFKEYISTRPPKYDEQGDFIRLAKANSTLTDVTSWSDLRSHMKASGAPSRVVEAGERVWVNYLNVVRDEQRRARLADQAG